MRGMSGVESVPYQRIRDSPTIKYYTDWRLFEEKRSLPYEEYGAPPPWTRRKYDAVITGKEIMVEKREDVLVEEITPGRRIHGIWIKPLQMLPSDTRMSLIHAYRWRAGAAVMIPPARVIQEPVRILSVGGGDGYAGHHILLYLGRGSQARVEIHDAAPEEGRGLKTLVVEAMLEASSHLELITMAKPSASSLLYHRKIIGVEAGGRVDSRSIVIGGGFTHYREDYELRDTKAEVSADYRLVSSGKCRLDAISNAVHKGSKTRSIIKARGAVMDEAYLTHRGLARIGREAVESETSIDSLILLLSRKAKANAVPMLEIRTSRVNSACHAASVASLDEDHLFYLASRGLSRDEATRLLLRDLLETGDSDVNMDWRCM